MSYPTWSDDKPAETSCWVLASEAWAETKAGRRRLEIREENRMVQVRMAPWPLVTTVTAGLVAVLMSFAPPLNPQRAKREAVIAMDPVRVVDELVTRQRAEKSSRAWGWT